MSAPGTTDEFLDLVQKSALVDKKRLGAYLEGLRAAGPLSPKPTKVAGSLVRDGILTVYGWPLVNLVWTLPFATPSLPYSLCHFR
jgi:hypothetical protein